MKKLRNKFIGIAIILLLAFTFRPIQNIDESQCAQTSGVIKFVQEGSTNDIVITLENRSASFYINRGAERGLSLGALQDTAIGKAVRIWYVHQYSILTLLSSNKHISRLDISGQTAFNELVSNK